MDKALTQALDTVRRQVENFDRDDWQTDIGGQRREWWLKVFATKGPGLVKLLEKIFNEATLEDSGCLCFPVKRKSITWEKHRQCAYEIVAFAVAGEPPTDKTVIRHLCHNDRCVHPDHLRIGSQKENLWDQRRRRADKAADI